MSSFLHNPFCTISQLFISGNNVVSFKGTETQVTNQNGNNLKFNFNFNANLSPTAKPNLDLARTNAFVVANTMHDIAYKYGFTESNFNFQEDNFGLGGRGGDRVTISVQDESGLDNASFLTPPDGQSGLMQMFLFQAGRGFRDAALNNAIMVHEVSNVHLVDREQGADVLVVHTWYHESPDWWRNCSLSADR